MFFAATALFSCSKDLGNYDYNAINTYEVTGLKSGTGVAGNYDLVLGQQLNLVPEIKSKMNENSPDLSYFWMVGSDTISTTKDLDYKVDLPIAMYPAKFELRDNKTGMKYISSFTFNITSPFGRGYFFLNQDEQNKTWLGFKNVSDEINDIVNTDQISGEQFGSFPVKMAGVQRFRTGPNDYSWEVYIVSKEGKYPVVFADLTKYAALKYFDKRSYAGTWGTEYEFKPTHVDLRSSGRTYFISNGRVALFDDYNLYRHSLLFDNTPDYKLDDILIGDINRFSGARSLIGFDLLRSKFKVISAYPASDPAKGIVFNANLLDRALEVESPANMFDGHKVVGAFSAYISSTKLLNSKVFTIQGNTVHLVDLNVGYVSPYVPELVHKGSQVIAGLTSTSPMTFFEDPAGDSYVVAGNKIYKSSIVNLGFVEYKTIDASLGEITAIKYQKLSKNSNTPRLYICTYDKNSTAALKGSILIYDVITGKLVHELKHVTNKVVDIFLGE